TFGAARDAAKLLDAGAVPLPMPPQWRGGAFPVESMARPTMEGGGYRDYRSGATPPTPPTPSSPETPLTPNAAASATASSAVGVAAASGAASAAWRSPPRDGGMLI
ncbi:unnamed protein product, partial [Phaeothamnion confervicola]